MRYIFILFIAFSINLNTFSQSQIVFDESRPESFLVKYESSEGNSPKNHIIKTIAEGSSKSLYSTKFSFTFNQKSQIIKSTNKVDFNVTLNNTSFNGDITYKGFNISDFLFPKTINFKINWLTTSNVLIKSLDFDNIELTGSPITMLNYQEIDSTTNTNYKLST